MQKRTRGPDLQSGLDGLKNRPTGKLFPAARLSRRSPPSSTSGPAKNQPADAGPFAETPPGAISSVPAARFLAKCLTGQERPSMMHHGEFFPQW